MKVNRIDLTAWTASFRYPNLISGVQPTLEAPPLSTVLGLLNAVTGQYIRHTDLQIGYYFEFAAKEVDLETTYQIESGSSGKPTNTAKSNIVRREFLFDVQLSIYLTDNLLAEAFRQPVYPILLGRSGDLATVERIVEIDLEEKTGADKIKGQVVPFAGNFLPGVVQALPRYFTNTFPRQNLGTEAFTIIPFHQSAEYSSRLAAFNDESKGKKGVDIFFHQFNLGDYD